MASILLVDDSLFMRTAVGRVLTEAGFEVAEATDLGAAFARLASARPGCVVTNLTLPDAEGVDVVRALRGGAADVPIIVLADAEHEALRDACTAAGARTVIIKPLRGPELLAAVQTALGGTTTPVALGSRE